MAVVRATIFHTLYGQQLQNVVHFQQLDATEAMFGLLPVRIRERFVKPIAGNQTNRLQYYRVRCEKVGSGTTWAPVETSFAWTGQFFGSETFAPMACVFQFRTSVNARRGRGRIYMSGMYSSDFVNGTWTASRLVAFGDTCNTLKAWWVSGGANFGSENGNWQLCLSPRSDPDDTLDVTNIVPRAYAGTQVRRNFFRGM